MEHSNLLKLLLESEAKDPQGVRSMIENLLKTNSVSSTRNEVCYNISLCYHCYFLSIYRILVTNQPNHNCTIQCNTLQAESNVPTHRHTGIQDSCLSPKNKQATVSFEKEKHSTHNGNCLNNREILLSPNTTNSQMSDMTNLTLTTANSGYVRREGTSKSNRFVSDTSHHTTDDESVRSGCSRSCSSTSRSSSQKSKKKMTEEEAEISELVRNSIFPKVKFFPPRPAEGLTTLECSYAKMVCWCVNLLLENNIIANDVAHDKDVLSIFQHRFEQIIVVYLKNYMAKVKSNIRKIYIGMCYHSCFTLDNRYLEFILSIGLLYIIAYQVTNHCFSFFYLVSSRECCC